MTWSVSANFNTIIGANARADALAVHDGLLWCHARQAGVDYMYTFDGTTWSQDHIVSPAWSSVDFLYSYDGLLFASVRNAGIYSYDGVSWTQEHSAFSVGNFAEYGGALYSKEFNSGSGIHSVIVRNDGTGTWGIVATANNGNRVFAVDGNVYVSGRDGSLSTGTNYLRRAFTTNIWTKSNSGVPVANRHVAPAAVVKYSVDGAFHVFEYKYITTDDGGDTDWPVTHTFVNPTPTSRSEVTRDMIEFNGALWAGHDQVVWKYDGVSWASSGTLGYREPDTAGGSALDAIPPTSFARHVNKLYVCAGPGIVYVNDEVEAFPNFKGIGISKSKSIDELLWITGWKPSELVLRAYNSTTLAPEVEVSLGAASISDVNAGTLVAYPYTPIAGGEGRVIVYGRFAYSGITHVMQSTNSGSSFTIIEDGWGSDVCGSILTRLGKIYAVRNKTTAGLIYSGFDELTFVNSLPFPVNPYGFKLSPTQNAIFAINKISGDLPRVVGIAYPFTGAYVDITVNYPVSGIGTAIVPL